MKCLICSSPMQFFFSKKYDSFDLGEVEYWKCNGCGFTLSKTHAEMSADTWQRLNYQYHSTYQGNEISPDDPKWIARLNTQAAVISDLADIGLLDTKGRWLDFACGDGKLSDILKEHYDLELLKYDRYMRDAQGFLDDEALVKGSFDFVITTSVFEHFTRRTDFDLVESLVSADGVLGLHTLVCEDVPPDPSWFYLLPVHCAFHTNKSMSILFKQWGYRASIYNVEAQLWLWFRTDPEEIQSIAIKANLRESRPKYVYKADFVDYWKVLPYRK